MYEHQAFVDGLYAFLDYTDFDVKMRNVFGIAAEFIDKEVIGLFRTEDGVYP